MTLFFPVVVFAQMSYWADLASFVGLAIGMAGGFFSLRTWFIAGSIKQALESSHNKHLLAARSGDYIKQLEKMSRAIADLTKPNVSDFQIKLTKIVAECTAICESIRAKIGDSKKDGNSKDIAGISSPLSELEVYVEQVPLSSDLGTGESNQLDLGRFLELVARLQSGIGHAAKDRKESL